MAATAAANVTSFTAKTSSAAIISSGVNKVVGWALSETTASVGASAAFYDNATAATGTALSGPLITLASNESIRDFFGEIGLLCATGGVYLSVISGSVSGAVYWE